jgi:hypothetical protein
MEDNTPTDRALFSMAFMIFQKEAPELAPDYRSSPRDK